MKTLHFFLIALIFLCSCKKEEEYRFYTTEQEETITGIIGTWKASPSWYLRKLCFENHVDYSVAPNWIFTDDVIFQVQGECYYVSIKDTTSCFFEISEECDRLRLLDKSDSTVFIDFKYFFLLQNEIWLKYELSDKSYQIFEK